MCPFLSRVPVILFFRTIDRKNDWTNFDRGEVRKMKNNLFAVLGIQTREDCISNALAYAINTSKSFRDQFMKQVCGKDLSKYTSVTAYTRISAGASGIPDIVITLESQSNADIVVIENKLKADEGNDQTIRYSSREAIDTLMKRLLPEKTLGEASFIFLTLFPDQHPGDQQYAVHRHSELPDVVSKMSEWDNELAKQLITDWLALVKSFYERENVSLSDIFHDVLADGNLLDGGFLYFRQALAQLSLPGSLELEGFFRSSQQGRRYYGAIISKDLWHPSEMTEVSGAWNLEPQTSFNIHLEPQYNVLSGVFNCFLHYEVNPYEPERWVKANISASQYSEYLDRRNKFSSLLQNQSLSGWSFGGGSNQIAKTSFGTYKEVKTTLELEIGRIAQAIDTVLDQM